MSLISQIVESQTVDKSNVEDYSGVSYINESGIYDLKIKRAWVIESAKGALGIHTEFEGEAILEYDFWITNADKQTFYTKNGKDVAMPSYVDMKKLNYVITGEFLTSLAQLSVSNQIVKTYELKEDPENPEKKKRFDVEKEVEYITSWAGKEVKVGIQMSEKEATTKQGDKYVGTGKRAEDKDGKPYLDINIIGFYNTETNQTANEMKKETEANQINKDKERLDKAPVRLFKSKGSKPSTGGATTGGASVPKKPSVFAPIGLENKSLIYAC